MRLCCKITATFPAPFWRISAPSFPLLNLIVNYHRMECSCSSCGREGFRMDKRRTSRHLLVKSLLPNFIDICHWLCTTIIAEGALSGTQNSTATLQPEFLFQRFLISLETMENHASSSNQVCHYPKAFLKLCLFSDKPQNGSWKCVTDCNSEKAFPALAKVYVLVGGSLQHREY